MGFLVPSRTANGIAEVSLETKLFENRNIYLEGEINASSALQVVKQIQYLNFENPEQPINLFINTHGGEILSGMLIYDAMQDSICPINTICLGCAYSMGAILVAGGTGTRYILPHSKMMLHEPLINQEIGGNASSIKELSNSINNTKDEMNEILAKHSGRSVTEVSKATSFDHFYTAKEALKFGLVDAISGLTTIMKEVLN